MKTFLTHSLALTTLMMGLFAGSLHAQAPRIIPPTLSEALKLKNGKAVIFQPVQMKKDQVLLVTHAGLVASQKRTGLQFGVMLAVYSTDPATHGDVLHQELFVAPAGAGTDAQVKIFNGYTPAATQQGIIAILIGLLIPADQSGAVPAQLPRGDSISAEIHDPTIGIGLLLPAVQKVREAAAR